MVRVEFFVAGALVGGLAMGAAARAEGRGSPSRLTPVQLVGAQMTTGPSNMGAALRATVAGGASPAVPACARKVKVIYAGYGEADRASCTIVSAAPGR